MKKLLLSLTIAALLIMPFGGLGIAQQSFRVSATSGSVTGLAGEYLDAHVDVTNLTSSALLVHIERTQQIFPEGWSNTLCLKQCWAPNATKMDDELLPNETAFFKATFETSPTPGNGTVVYKLSNKNNPQEFVTISLSCTTSTTTSVVSLTAPKAMSLSQNYPNPFSMNRDRQTTFSYGLPGSGTVTMKVYDMLGQEVRTLVNTWSQAGTFTVAWDGRSQNGSPVPAGIYICKLTTGTDAMSRRVLVSR